VDLVDDEAGGGDGGDGVPASVAAGEQARPHRGVDKPLGSVQQAGVGGGDVFEEPELAAGAEHAADLGEGGGLVGHGAQHERGDGGIELPVAGGQVLGQTVDDLDGYRRGP